MLVDGDRLGQQDLTDEAVASAAAGAPYDLWYRVYVHGMGWLGWAKGGDAVGTEGLSRGINAIQVALLPAGSDAPGPTDGAVVAR